MVASRVRLVQVDRHRQLFFGLRRTDLAKPHGITKRIRGTTPRTGYTVRLLESAGRLPVETFGARVGSVLIARGGFLDGSGPFSFELAVGTELFLFVRETAVLAVPALLPFLKVRAKPVWELDPRNSRCSASSFGVLGVLAFALALALGFGLPFAFRRFQRGCVRQHRLHGLTGLLQGLGIVAITTTVAEPASILVPHFVADGARARRLSSWRLVRLLASFAATFTSA